MENKGRIVGQNMGSLLQDDFDGGAAPKLDQPAFEFDGMKGALPGLAIISAAATLAVSEPPHWLHRDAYFVALSGAFFAGVTQVTASVSTADGNNGGRRHATGLKIVYAALLIAYSLALASLLQ